MKKLLDVGCGPGTIGNIGLYNKLSKDYQIHGIDPDRKNTAQIKKRFGIGTFTTGLAERIPYPDNTFDCILIHHVLEHVSDLSATLKEISRVSKKNAILSAAVPHPLFEKILNRTTPKYMGKGNHHQRVFTDRILISALSDNGFSVDQVRYDKWPYFVLIILLTIAGKITGKIHMEEQTGVFLVSNNNYIQNEKQYGLYNSVYAILNILNRILFFLNYLIPFEISTTAINRKA